MQTPTRCGSLEPFPKRGARQGGTPVAIEVKPLLPHEWPTLKQVRLRALADAPDAFSTTLAQAEAYSDDDWRTRAGRFAIGPPAAMCIAYMDGMPCGMMSCYPAASAKQAAELTAAWADPAARGQGVADALVASIAGWARAQGFALLQAWVVENNPRAIAFYKKVGFAETGPREPVAPGSPHSMVLLAQRL